MDEELMYEVIYNYVELKKEENPQKYSNNDYIYESIVVENLLYYIKKYNVDDWEKLDFKVVIKFVNYNRYKCRDEVKRKFPELIELQNRANREFFVGMDYSRGSLKEIYDSVCESSTEEVVEYMMNLVCEVFNKQMFVEYLFFFLLMERFKTKPTKKLYQRFKNCYHLNNYDSIMRELRINEILNTV